MANVPPVEHVVAIEATRMADINARAAHVVAITGVAGSSPLRPDLQAFRDHVPMARPPSSGERLDHVAFMKAFHTHDASRREDDDEDV
jgi:hypothetical protein